jgi:uncharacterized protein (DUF1810 family)
MSDLARFVAAQEQVYARALDELRHGRKQSHWMWFIFPQIAGLGHSPMARLYAIADLGEARDYLAHPLLGPRLAACTRAMLAQEGETARAILGEIDAVKLRSSMTLFERAGGADMPFARCLDSFYAGARDPATLALLDGRPA